MDNDIIITRRYAAPCGTLVLGSAAGRLCLCLWDGLPRSAAIMRRTLLRLGAVAREGNDGVTDTAARELDEYFDGRRRSFDIPLLPSGTGFQLRVWQELSRIPYGTTVSYAGQARLMGCPQSVRAVAAADGANPITVIVPCHRVVAGDGRLTGYSGGLEVKRFLLGLERRP